MSTATSARVIADSLSYTGDRLTTLEVAMPRIVLAEFNTHRVFSRNSASSRAIPVEKQIKRVLDDPFVPDRFPINRPGMSADEYVTKNDGDYKALALSWLVARDNAVDQAQALMQRGVHKQVTNRLLEPFMWHTVIVSATEWDNFFKLRCHPAAQPEIRVAAEAIRDAIAVSVPLELPHGAWHAPLIRSDDLDNGYTDHELVMASVGRCARVSYLTHDGRRAVDEDAALAVRLKESGHWSPWEHVATPTDDTYQYANFRGWVQARWYAEQGMELPS